MRHLSQEDHADLGLIDNDKTEDMRDGAVCRLCGNTGWRPGPMAVIPCDHRGVVGRSAPLPTEMLTAPAKSGVRAPGESRHEHPTIRQDVHR